MTYDIVCAVCGKSFVSSRKWTKYCPECRPEVVRLQHNAACRRYRNTERGLAKEKERKALYRASGRAKEVEDRAKADGRYAQWVKNCKERDPEKWARRDREKSMRYYWRNRERIIEHKKEYAATHKEEIKAYRKIWDSAKKNLPGAKLKLAERQGKLVYCVRMRLKAYPLPCGTRGECKGCPHCPEGASCGVKESRHHFFDMDYMG